ncbi:MAG: 50S ribosomal protein L25 [Bacteroidetes bacterium]|nr:50S ribosomal protein L25 [Bacteroidota bacterium]MCW5897505.1 50S ribosomal protein L25 [Bacteroidota bacterium]
MAEITLNAELRTATGKSAKRVRWEGKIPGVYYAHGEENIPIQVPKLSLDPLIYTSETRVIDLRVGDISKKAILRDLQFDPVTDRAIHFDLQGLQEDEEITLEVPVVLVGGIPTGVRDGGMLQHIMHKVKISCLPKHIPGKIELNVAGLGINQSMYVRELTIPNVTVHEDPDDPVVSVVPPTVAKEAAPAEAAAAEAPKEPEVVGKGKKPEEGGEAAEGEKKK